MSKSKTSFSAGDLVGILSLIIDTAILVVLLVK
jgi:hypothetical protein